MKTGVAEAVEITSFTKTSGLKLMIGGMVETRMAMGCSYSLVLGLGGFEVLDLGKDISADRFVEAVVVASPVLAAEADVVIENFRVGGLDRWGLGYEALVGGNPGLVWCSITGFGQDGPYALAAGHDINYLGYAGVLDQIGCAGGAPALSNRNVLFLAAGDTTGKTGPAFTADAAALRPLAPGARFVVVPLPTSISPSG